MPILNTTSAKILGAEILNKVQGCKSIVQSKLTPDNDNINKLRSGLEVLKYLRQLLVNSYQGNFFPYEETDLVKKESSHEKLDEEIPELEKMTVHIAYLNLSKSILEEKKYLIEQEQNEQNLEMARANQPVVTNLTCTLI